MLAETYRREVESYKQAIIELEATMIDMGGQPIQAQQQ